MNVLVLGGTGFLSREAALSFHRAGHDVTCAARGITAPPPQDCSFIVWDRDDEVPDEIGRLKPDIVLDVSTNPEHVADACRLFPDTRWIYISTISVYPTMTEPFGTPDNTAVFDPVVEPDGAGVEAYGGSKIACEIAVSELPNYMIIRPGLIVGPGDPSGRFTYWPSRLAQASSDGLPYIAPLPADDPVQWVDVRDLADWIVHLSALDATGVVEAIGPPIPRSEFLAEISSLFTPEPVPVWVPRGDLEDESVGFWAGDRALPFWLPVPELKEMMNRDPGPASDLGLGARPLAQTARDTLSWHLNEGHNQGLSRADEIEVLTRLGHITAL